jgi:catechol 2,3-dioxygenase-like lactoylglutathione lyase family enzyme
MTVRGVGFVGMRTDRLEETIDLFETVIGLPLTRRDADVAGFTLADGTLVELFGPADTFHAFFTTGPVVGFRVDDFDTRRRAMLAAGVAFIGAPQHADGVSWQHFRCPDGTIAEIMGPGAAVEK